MIEVYVASKLQIDSEQYLQTKQLTYKDRITHKIERACADLARKFAEKVLSPDVNFTEHKLRFDNIHNLMRREFHKLLEAHLNSSTILDPAAIDTRERVIKAEFLFVTPAWDSRECVVKATLRDTKNTEILIAETNIGVSSRVRDIYEITDVAGGNHVYENVSDVITTESGMFSCISTSNRTRRITIKFAYLANSTIMHIRFNGVRDDTTTYGDANDTDNSCADEDDDVV